MKIIRNRIGFVLALLFMFTTRIYAQSGWYIAAHGAFSKPIGQLSNWFKYGQTLSFSMGQQNEKDWFVEGMLEYSAYTQENLSGYPKGKLELYLKHVAIWANGKYPLLSFGNFTPYLSIAGGPVYWEGRRGEIDANEELSIPHIPAKLLHEWDMGAKLGLGFFINFGRLKLSGTANYRLIIGNLYPTMQEYIELDGVNGFQSLNFRTGIYYHF